jgi:hypothetical protein
MEAMTKRDPKPTSADSWWTKFKTSTELNKEALRRWPSATTGETFTGVTLMTAKKQGTL